MESRLRDLRSPEMRMDRGSSPWWKQSLGVSGRTVVESKKRVREDYLQLFSTRFVGLAPRRIPLSPTSTLIMSPPRSTICLNCVAF